MIKTLFRENDPKFEHLLWKNLENALFGVEKHRKRDFDDFVKYMGEFQENKVRNSLFFHIFAKAFIVENCTFLLKSALFDPVSEDPVAVVKYMGENQGNDPRKRAKKYTFFPLLCQNAQRILEICRIFLRKFW
jgi:hypothetical protein